MTSTYTSYRLISQDIGKSLERVSKQPDVARETEYYRAKIGDVKSIDDFMADTRLYNYALKAHGLEDMAYAKAFIRKVLTEGASDKNAFANKLSDNRYAELAKSLDFAGLGAAATSTEAAKSGVVSKYTRQTLEQEAGDDNNGVRLALYFERKAPTIKSGLDFLADDALAQVFRTTFNLPDAFAAADVDKQAALIEKASISRICRILKRSASCSSVSPSCGKCKIPLRPMTPWPFSAPPAATAFPPTC